MNAFEQIVRTVLERQGYWVRSGFRVDLSKSEKRAIGRPSNTRWELDLLAYKGAKNELLVVECKSYLDSRGTVSASFNRRHAAAARYKLFVEPRLRHIVFRRLLAQLKDVGACASTPRIKLCLAVARIPTERERRQLTARFAKKGWVLFDDLWIRNAIKNFAETRYEDDVATVAAKILLRKR